ncbi:CU044_5270 family protein [Streptomyces ovatisporus]|uniref:CU044_5270 family protein n=1 Tax=Streptomyces ovatisporus TaxID=1128682 RepID=A0ABV9ABS9_9ACTN
MTALRRMRAEIPRPHPDRLTTGREQLQAAIDEEETAHRTASDRRTSGGILNDIRITGDTGHSSRKLLHRRPLLGAAVAVAAAVAVTATAVVAGNIGGGEGGSTPSVSDTSTRSVSAKKTLDAAADRVREEEKGAEIDVPRDDQFIYTRETVRETDRKTGRTDVRTTENWESVDRSKRGWVDEIGGTGTWSEPLGKNESTFPPPGWKALEKLGTDPAGLIRYLAAGQGGAGKKPESLKEIRKKDWFMIQFSLKELATLPLAPKGLRPAAYEALAMVPGMKAEAGVEDGDGRPAVGVAYDHKFTRDQKLLFDEDSHEYLGDKDIRTTLNNKKSYDQWIRLTDYAVVDKVKQQP